MPKPNYTKTILEIIKKAKAVPHWSISDYLAPIRGLYATLSTKERKKFHLAIINLLHGREHLESILDICREVRLKEACPILMNLFLHPPRYKEDGHLVWIEGLRRSVVATLGAIDCHNALPVLKKVMGGKISGDGSRRLHLGLESYGVVLQALTNISPKDAATYLGWWIEEDKAFNRKAMAIVQKTDDWKKMKALGITFPLDERKSSFIQNCILSVARKGQLKGLREWLGSVTLLKESSRDYLKHQLEHMLTGNDPLANLKLMLKFQGNTKTLVEELAALPLGK